MKICLVFDDWRKNGESVYNELSTGEFHSGTTFRGEIQLPPETEAELRGYMKQGFRPVFWVMEDLCG